MNTNAQSEQTVEQDKTRFLKLISNSASAALGMVLVAVPRANAAPTVCTKDCNFIQAATQGGMPEVKLG